MTTLTVQEQIPDMSGSCFFAFLFRLAYMALLQHRRVLGGTIRARRKQAGFSQEKLAEKADLNPKYLSEVEGGQVNISVDAVARLAKALGTRVHDLTEGF